MENKKEPLGIEIIILYILAMIIVPSMMCSFVANMTSSLLQDDSELIGLIIGFIISICVFVIIKKSLFKRL